MRTGVPAKPDHSILPEAAVPGASVPASGGHGHRLALRPGQDKHRALRDRRLLRAYKDDGSTAARDALVAACLPQVRALARGRIRPGVQLDDLIQVGSIGLIKAINRFDLTRDVEFIAYAVPTIVGEMRHYLRDRVSLVAVPRSLREASYELERSFDSLTAELGRSPTLSELALAAGVKTDHASAALHAHGLLVTLSLSPSGAPDRWTVPDLVDPSSEAGLAHAASDARALLAAALGAVRRRDLTVLYLRFFWGMTQSEIAATVGISQAHVSRLIRRSLEVMYDELHQPI